MMNLATVIHYNFRPRVCHERELVTYNKSNGRTVWATLDSRGALYASLTKHEEDQWTLWGRGVFSVRLFCGEEEAIGFLSETITRQSRPVMEEVREIMRPRVVAQLRKRVSAQDRLIKKLSKAADKVERLEATVTSAGARIQALSKKVLAQYTKIVALESQLDSQEDEIRHELKERIRRSVERSMMNIMH
jgi:uncharacterized coiled-coil protein SlyX